MSPFTVLRSLVIPLDRPDVDTDAILPKQFMKSVSRTGFGVHLFDAWRYLDQGYLGKPVERRHLDPAFVLNQPRYQGAEILLARENFGCGSSREHALWALSEYGIRAILAPSFSGIFYENCFKNGVLPVSLEPEVVHALFDEAAENDLRLTVDLPSQQLTFPNGRTQPFSIDAERKSNLIKGLDEIAATLLNAEKIRQYEIARRRQEPWVFGAQERA